MIYLVEANRNPSSIPKMQCPATIDVSFIRAVFFRDLNRHRGRNWPPEAVGSGIIITIIIYIGRSGVLERAA